MTLKYKEHKGMKSNSKSRVSMKIGEALQHVVRDASHDNRLVTGVLHCSQVLHSCPARVMFCLLETSKASNFSHKLIEAYCRENGVRIFKVDNFKTLMKLTYITLKPIDTHPSIWKQQDTHDLQCVLVTVPETLSREEEFVHTFYKIFMNWKGQTYPTCSIPE